MELLGLIGIVVVLALIIGAVSKGRDRTKVAKYENQLAREYPEAKTFVSVYDSSYVAVDFSADRLMVGLKRERGRFVNPERPYARAYDFNQIAEVALVKDGTTVTSTNRGSQAVGAAVGAVAFGGIGAIIGGLSGSSTGQDRVRRITLRIKVDDPQHPVHDITMFYWGANKKGVKTDSALVKPVLKKAEEFGTHVSNAIRRASKEAASTSVIAANVGSTSQQIAELWRLKEVGALTEQEFLAEKAKVLNADCSQKIVG